MSEAAATVERMDKSNAYAIAALLAVAGFLVGRMEAKPAAPAAAPVVAPAGAPAAPITIPDQGRL